MWSESRTHVWFTAGGVAVGSIGLGDPDGDCIAFAVGEPPLWGGVRPAWRRNCSSVPLLLLMTSASIPAISVSFQHEISIFPLDGACCRGWAPRRSISVFGNGSASVPTLSTVAAAGGDLGSPCSHGFMDDRRCRVGSLTPARPFYSSDESEAKARRHPAHLSAGRQPRGRRENPTTRPSSSSVIATGSIVLFNRLEENRLLRLYALNRATLRACQRWRRTPEVSMP